MAPSPWGRVLRPEPPDPTLGVAFIANDGEEVLTMVSTLPGTLDALPSWLPVPERARRIDQRHVNVSIAMMGGLCTAAVIDGVRTRGRGRLYQDFQWIFGLHGFGHLVTAAITRRYATGSVSSPLVVLPQLWYATRALRRSGVARSVNPVRAVGIVGGWLAISHTVGALVSQRARRHDDDGL